MADLLKNIQLLANWFYINIAIVAQVVVNKSFVTAIFLNKYHVVRVVGHVIDVAQDIQDG